MDVVASTGFGLQIDSQTNKDDPFVKYAKMAFDITIFSPIILLISTLLLFSLPREIPGLIGADNGLWKR